MAWTNRTIHNVAPDPEPNTPASNREKREETNKLDLIFKDMPPFIKISSARARRALSKYEVVKQRHIKALRENDVFKFVMMVAGLTNEPMEKYWKGKSASPFSDTAVPMNTKICKEDLEMLIKRARERAFADLHQFCGPVYAIPMFRGGAPASEAAETHKKAKQKINSRMSNAVSNAASASPLTPRLVRNPVRNRRGTDNFRRAVRFTDESVDSELYGGASNNDAAAQIIARAQYDLNSPGAWKRRRRRDAEIQANERNLVQPLNFSGSEGLSPASEDELPGTPMSTNARSDAPDSFDPSMSGAPAVPRRAEISASAVPAGAAAVRGTASPTKKKKKTSGDKPKETKPPSKVKYIYNMSDEEFEVFIRDFWATRSESRHTIRRYVLGRDIRGKSEPYYDGGENPFPAHEHFRGQDWDDDRVNPRRRTRQHPGGTLPQRQGPAWYNEEDNRGEVPRTEIGDFNLRDQTWNVGRGYPVPEDRFGTPRPPHHSRDRIFDYNRVFGQNNSGGDGYDHLDGYVTLRRSNWWEWSDSQPIVRWDSEKYGSRPEFWFQRYIARWLVREANSIDNKNRPIIRGADGGFQDLEKFKNQYLGLFNNLSWDEEKGIWMRNLTGLRLSKMIRAPSRRLGNGTELYDGDMEDFEGMNDMSRPCQDPCEVPLDFVRPLFNERFTYWKHEMVLGEYERRAMYQADQWLQKTPWAIGKIYLQPGIFAHMQEAHVAIVSKFKKFAHMNEEDWLGNEKCRYFFSKLVALCIRTTAVLSNKKYGLDKAYMRLNLEKRRIMHAIGKLEVPRRTRNGVPLPRATLGQQDAWHRYEAARRANDTSAAANALRDMN
jgi:hypothetical protein